ncbi:MAG: DNA polymerase domain-containing protein, partial [Halobacteriota archaeon]|nr:DNA polymerase domain-containing protein [Halobacteriota archaeon]
MVEGWILDVDTDYEDNSLSVWIRTHDEIKRHVNDFRPSFYVHSGVSGLHHLYSMMKEDPSIDDLSYEIRRLWLGEEGKLVLKISVKEYKMLWKLARRIDEIGDFHKYELFNVDISIPLQYMLENHLFPMAFVRFNGDFVLLDDIDSIDYESPPLQGVELDVTVKKSDKIPTYDDPILNISIDEDILEDEDESELLDSLQKRILKVDPDIIYTDGGDTVVLPYLFHRASLQSLDDFYLGRERSTTTTKRDGKSYFSYGRVIYRPPKHLLRGRIHIDRRNSFIYSESGLGGLIELSRLSRIPLQNLSRVTPGTAVSAMQIVRALEENTLVMWKKKRPEKFKTLETLFLSDRGAVIYDPKVGIHDNVVEIDFTSLYPNIMVKYNISPETVLCDCCKDGKRIVPTVKHNICEKRVGLIPKVLQPIIERRSEYKRRINEERYDDCRDIYRGRSKALKWVLVTCFGYTGYRNARFGRIECHEAINAYAREIFIRSKGIAEDLGCEVLHGIVDSLWLKSDGEMKYHTLCSRICESTGLPIEIEGLYNWIVFLPNRSNKAGALNRYYGLLEDKEMKVRGIELRRRDTCSLIKRAQIEMLSDLAEAENSREFYECIPVALDTLKRYALKVREGDCKLEDLVFISTISKGIGDYEQFNNNFASLLQLREFDIKRNPGEVVQYIIMDSKSKRHHNRVKVWELIDGDERYDVDRYTSYLVKAAESILLPFGYTEKRLQEYLKPTSQCTLS